MSKRSASAKNSHPAGKVHKAAEALKEAGKNRKAGKPAPADGSPKAPPGKEQGSLPMYEAQSPANPMWSNQADRIAEKLKNTRNR